MRFIILFITTFFMQTFAASLSWDNSAEPATGSAITHQPTFSVNIDQYLGLKLQPFMVRLEELESKNKKQIEKLVKENFDSFRTEFIRSQSQQKSERTRYCCNDCCGSCISCVASVCSTENTNKCCAYGCSVCIGPVVGLITLPHQVLQAIPPRGKYSSILERTDKYNFHGPCCAYETRGIFDQVCIDKGRNNPGRECNTDFMNCCINECALVLCFPFTGMMIAHDCCLEKTVGSEHTKRGFFTEISSMFSNFKKNFLRCGYDSYEKEWVVSCFEC